MRGRVYLTTLLLRLLCHRNITCCTTGRGISEAAHIDTSSFRCLLHLLLLLLLMVVSWRDTIGWFRWAKVGQTATSVKISFDCWWQGWSDSPLVQMPHKLTCFPPRCRCNRLCLLSLTQRWWWIFKLLVDSYHLIFSFSKQSLSVNDIWLYLCLFILTRIFIILKFLLHGLSEELCEVDPAMGPGASSDLSHNTCQKTRYNSSSHHLLLFALRFSMTQVAILVWLDLLILGQ